MTTRPALLEPVDPQHWPSDTSVVIVGGGPIGLSAAILLAQRGIEVFLLERRNFEARYPRAHLLNVRTMEVFQSMGVADDIYRLGPQNDRWHKVSWYTSIAGPTSADGVKLGDVPAWGGGPHAARYAEASPQAFANLPQLHIDPLLHEHAEAACPGRIRGMQEVVGIENTAHGVTVSYRDRATGETREIRARYAIVADGGRVSEQLLGIEMEGPRAIREVVNYYVTTDLSQWSEPDALLAYFFHPSDGGQRRGTIQALGPTRYDRTSEEWLIAVSGWFRRDGQSALDSMREMLGLAPAHPITLHSESHWVYNGIVARKWRRGNVFIAGDAAHRHPPTGGLGLNSGVQDAENLAWKLAAVLGVQAPDSLLDSYEWERRPTTAYYTAHSLENATRHAPIAEALGFELGEEQARRNVETFLSDTAEGAALRAKVAEAVAENAMDYSQLNVEAGFHYWVGAFVPDGSPLREGYDSPIDFVPTTRPGHHLPHVWLEHLSDAAAGARVSTRDLVRAEGLTLFVSDVGEAVWREAVASLDSPTLISIAVIPTAESAWADVSELSEHGALLVRPDAKNAWRTTGLPVNPAEALAAAMATILRGGAPPESDPTEPYFARIRAAAAELFSPPRG